MTSTIYKTDFDFIFSSSFGNAGPQHQTVLICMTDNFDDFYIPNNVYLI